MAERRGVVLNEWIVVFLVPKPGSRGPVAVEVENVAVGDRGMAAALVNVLQVWINAARRPR